MNATRQTVEQLLQALYDGNKVPSEVIADAIEESGWMPKKWCFYGSSKEATWLEDKPSSKSTHGCGSVAHILTREYGSILKWIVEIRKADVCWTTIPSTTFLSLAEAQKGAEEAWLNHLRQGGEYFFAISYKRKNNAN